MTPAQLNAITAQVAEDLADAHEPLAAAYERILRGAGRRMARRLRARAVALTAALVPPDEDEVVPDLQTQIDRQTRRERDALIRMLAAAYEAHEIAWDIHGNFTAELLEKVGAHASFAVDAELRAVYRDVIQAAAEEGLSIPHTAREIVSAVDGLAGYRATALARTDMIGLANGASQTAATEAFAGREDVTKVWLATDDERTRETHVEANGQEVSLNEFFDVGGYEMLYPGDPDGPDEEVINCRCTVIYSGGGGAQEEEAATATASAVRPDAYAAETVPWHIEENHTGCPDGRPFAVVKDDDGEVEGCHATRAEAAIWSFEALYAQEADMSTTAAEPLAVTITVEDDSHPNLTEARRRTPWEGILAIAGSPTSDGRYLIPGEIGQRDLPLPLAASHEDQHATETVGRIEVIEHISLADFEKEGWTLPDDLPAQAVVIWGEGTFDGSPAADDALRALENGVGVSLDLPMDRQALIDATTFEEVDPRTLDDEVMLGLMFGMVPEGYLRGIAGKIGGLSLASISAFEETTIRITDSTAVVASGFALRTRDLGTSIGGLEYAEDSIQLPLVASAAPLEPPREWFFMDEPDEPTPITITADGRVYGHLALWNTCHAGRANGAYSSCMFAPHSPSGYKQFHLGAILCDDGSEVAIGRMTIGTGHAPLHLNAAAARRHYDHSGTCVAFVRAKDGVFGIWICGTLKSDATAEAIRDLRACPPSGDWRAVDGTLELQAALAVNVPGYAVPRSQLALAASGDVLDIATLILSAPDEKDMHEAMRAEHALLDVDMLVEMGAAGGPFVTKIARSLAAK
jgi:hypothetical protein